MKERALIIQDENGNPVINPETRSIPQFKELIRRDKSRGKTRVLQEFAYIYHMCSFGSFIEEYPHDERPLRSAQAAGLNANYAPDNKVQACIDYFEENQDTRVLRIIRSAYRAADNLQQYFNSVDFNKKDKGGKPIYTAKGVMENVKNLGEFIDNLRNLEQKVKEELSNEAGISGGHKKHLFEDPA